MSEDMKAYIAIVDEVSNFNERSHRCLIMRHILLYFEEAIPEEQRVLHHRLKEFADMRSRQFHDLIIQAQFSDDKYETPREKASNDEALGDILGRHFK